AVKPGWHESARLLTAVVGEPGSKKSPALALAATPFSVKQQEFYEALLAAKIAYENQVANYERELAIWKKQFHGGEATIAEKPTVPQAPQFTQLFTTDSTMEALAEVLERNNRGVVYMNDELSAWCRSFDQYKNGKGADRQHWLSFWSGSQVIINRKYRKDPVVLPNPFVSVTGC